MSKLSDLRLRFIRLSNDIRQHPNDPANLLKNMELQGIEIEIKKEEKNEALQNKSN